jgi:hypothetical protein
MEGGRRSSRFCEREREAVEREREQRLCKRESAA